MCVSLWVHGLPPAVTVKSFLSLVRSAEKINRGNGEGGHSGAGSREITRMLRLKRMRVTCFLGNSGLGSFVGINMCL